MKGRGKKRERKGEKEEVDAMLLFVDVRKVGCNSAFSPFFGTKNRKPAAGANKRAYCFPFDGTRRPLQTPGMFERASYEGRLSDYRQ